ncbi:MAG: MFS transporter, partial [Devosia sp.]
ATIYYFTFFMASGAATVYGGIWFKEQGLSEEQIGVIGSLPVFIMLVLNLVVGRIADRAPDWRRTIVFGTVVAGVFSIGLFFAHGFWPILLVWTLASVPVNAVQPVGDAATMRMTKRNGTDFGAIRAWGTVGYLSAIFAMGLLAAHVGGWTFLPVFVGVCLLRALASLGLPNFRAAPGEQQPMPAGKAAGRLIEVMRPWFLLPLVGWAMVFATHLILNTFQALLWSQQGIAPDIIGLLLAIGAASEAAMMFLFKRIADRFPARVLLLVSAGVMVLRMIAMGFSPGVPVLVGLQMLHSITFAMGFMGCMHFIANWTSEDIAAEAQSFFSMLQQGMAVIALLVFGKLATTMGASAYFVSAGVAAAGGVLIWASLQLHPSARRAG